MPNCFPFWGGGAAKGKHNEMKVAEEYCKQSRGRSGSGVLQLAFQLDSLLRAYTVIRSEKHVVVRTSYSVLTQTQTVQPTAHLGYTV